MNKTRKLTQGAMFLAIVGAVMLIDRQLSYAFTELVVMALSVVIVMYSAMYEFKDGIYLSLCLLVLILLFGSTYSYIYGPISIVVGLAYSFGLSKNYSTRTLMLISIVTYTICEFVATYAIYPLLGQSVTSQIVAIEEMMNETGLSSYLEVLGSFKDNLLMICFVASIVLMGIMEGLIIHLLSILLLRRFKIKEIPVTSLIDIKVNPLVAYISMLFVILGVIIKPQGNETIASIVAALSLIGGVILIYYGYVFVMLYMNVVMRSRHPFIFILIVFLTFPFSLFALLILGFLYGSGPLYNKLQSKRGDK